MTIILAVIVQPYLWHIARVKIYFSLWQFRHSGPNPQRKACSDCGAISAMNASHQQRTFAQTICRHKNTLKCSTLRVTKRKLRSRLSHRKWHFWRNTWFWLVSNNINTSFLPNSCQEKNWKEGENALKWVGHIPATCALTHFPPLCSFASSVLIEKTVFGAVYTDFLAQKAGNRFVDMGRTASSEFQTKYICNY